ncbi:MAG TPA: hypothetical protein VMT45_06500 [Thermoanaerobaculaceae bacterium]|nr:hypothetical protein [Thermoanaerobaculaceae bacterium]
MAEEARRGEPALRRIDDCGEGPFCAVAILGGGDYAVPHVVCAHFRERPTKGLCFVYMDRVWRLVEKRPSQPRLLEGGDLFWEARPVER